jgi:DNA repair protein RecO (recombination protein O)
MRTQSRGIVLHATEYSETSLVVKIYTEEKGLGTFIVGGVRTKKSRYNSTLFQPLSLVELVASGKPGQTMQRITEIHFSPPFSGIPSDMIKSTIAIFMAEVIYRSIREEEPNKALFHFLNSSIQILDLHQGNCSRFHLYFMTQLTRHLGFYPQGTFHKGRSIFDLREGTFTDRLPSHPDYTGVAESELLASLLTCSFENYTSVAIGGAASKSLLSALVTYFELHQTHGNPIRSHRILEEVMS